MNEARCPGITVYTFVEQLFGRSLELKERKLLAPLRPTAGIGLETLPFAEIERE